MFSMHMTCQRMGRFVCQVPSAICRSRGSSLRGCRYQTQPSLVGRAFSQAPAQPSLDQLAFYGAGFEVYKGKAAVQFKPVSPTVSRTGNGGGIQMQRKGVLLMDVAAGSGQKSYDWENKITMALSVVEMSQLFLTDFHQVTQMQFLHDPGLQTANRGQVTKTLNVYPGTDGNTLMLTFAERSAGSERKVTVPLSAAEFRVVAEMSRYLIPHFLGLDQYVDSRVIASSYPKEEPY